MERRELLKIIAVLTGGALVGGDVFLTGCRSAVKQGEGVLTAAQIATLNEVGETIIPATDTPGAKAAKVGEFMQVYVTDCYRPEVQKAFTAGLTSLDEKCKKQFNADFIKLTAEQRTTILTGLEAEAKTYNQAISDKEQPARDAAKAALKEFYGQPRHYYSLMKQLTLLGYFTSEVGMKQALRFLHVPGKYDGAYPYKKGDKAWAI